MCRIVRETEKKKTNRLTKVILVKKSHAVVVYSSVKYIKGGIKLNNLLLEKLSRKFRLLFLRLSYPPPILTVGHCHRVTVGVLNTPIKYNIDI